MSGLILPGGDGASLGDKQEPIVIGKQLRPVAELQDLIGCRVILRNPNVGMLPVLGAGGLIGILHAVHKSAIYPKRADAIGGANNTSPGGIWSMKAEMLELSEPYANPPGTDVFIPMLED